MSTTKTSANWPAVLDILCNRINATDMPADDAIFWAAGLAACHGLHVESSDELTGVASKITLCNDDESAWVFLRISDDSLTAEFDVC
jgi:hypothetical protein